MEIIWKKNDDARITRAQIDTQIDKTLSKLFIENVVEGDSGEYSCEAHNRPGIVARSTVKICVKGKMTSHLINSEWLSIILSL